MNGDDAPVEVIGSPGLTLDQVEAWCEAMRDGGAADRCPVFAQDGRPLTRLAGWPRVTAAGDEKPLLGSWPDGVADEFDPRLVAAIAAGITLTDEQKHMGLTPEKMAAGVLRLRAHPGLVAELDAIVGGRYAAQQHGGPSLAGLCSEDGQLEEALAGFKRIADAAGIFEQTWQARSISEVAGQLAAWCAQRRER